MTLIESEFTKIDKENNIVEITYSVNKKIYSVIRFDFNNDNTVVSGDLFNLIGLNSNEEDVEKYRNYIKAQQWFAKQVLERY